MELGIGKGKISFSFPPSFPTPCPIREPNKDLMCQRRDMVWKRYYMSSNGKLFNLLFIVGKIEQSCWWVLLIHMISKMSNGPIRLFCFLFCFLCAGKFLTHYPLDSKSLWVSLQYIRTFIDVIFVCPYAMLYRAEIALDMNILSFRVSGAELEFLASEVKS